MPQLTVNKLEWIGLLGETLDSKYLLTELISSERSRAIFRAEVPADHTQVLIAARDGEAADAEAVRRRYLEASYLRHENLLAVLRGARAELQGQSIVYAVQETADENLEKVWNRGALAFEELREIIAQLARGLAYVHSENLVYCALTRASVWGAGGKWKLGDFSQLRIPGSTRANETRVLLTRHSNAPPEAFEGTVAPSWDVWALGSMLGKLAGRASPFDRIVAGCVQPNPSDRWTLEQVEEALAQLEAPASPTGASDAAPAPFSDAAVAPAAVDPNAEEPRASEFPLKQNRWLQVLVAVLVGALVVCCIGLIILFLPDRHPKIPGKPVQPPAQSARVTPSPAAASPVGGAVLPAADGIDQLLRRWADSTRRKNAVEQAACYAPMVDQFYGWHNVSSDRIRREKERQFSQIGKVTRFDISNVRVNPDGPEKATVSFDKTWDFGQGSRFQGSERAQLNVARIGGQWRITGEREMKVYWVRR